MQPTIDTYSVPLLARLGLDPETLPQSHRTTGGRLTVGVSDWTVQKLWELYRIVDVVCSISMNINCRRVREGKRSFPFVGIDLSAGLGAYRYKPNQGPPVALVGSPLQLLDAVVRHELPYHLGLFERDPKVLLMLRQHLSSAMAHLGVDSTRVALVEGDFVQTAPDWIVHNVQAWTLGLLIVDVNAVFDSPELQTIAARPELKRVDVALHIPASMSKWPERRRPPATLDELRAAFGKDHWQVARPRGNYQWTWVYGTNNPDMRVLKERDFVPADSLIGQARFERMRTTHAERKRYGQAGLFEGLRGDDDLPN